MNNNIKIQNYPSVSLSSLSPLFVSLSPYRRSQQSITTATDDGAEIDDMNRDDIVTDLAFARLPRPEQLPPSLSKQQRCWPAAISVGVAPSNQRWWLRQWDENRATVGPELHEWWSAAPSRVTDLGLMTVKSRTRDSRWNREWEIRSEIANKRFQWNCDEIAIRSCEISSSTARDLQPSLWFLFPMHHLLRRQPPVGGFRVKDLGWLG